jgi:hypothetical protein
MSLNALSEFMQTDVRNNGESTAIANTLAKGKSREVCIRAFKTAFQAGTGFGSHDVVVAGANQRIKLKVSVNGQVQYLIEFKIWMAVDILELVTPGMLTLDDPEDGIYGAYKKDYEKLVAARAQNWPNHPVPLTASCTLIYFLNPADGAGDVPPFPKQVEAGGVWFANNPGRCQVSAASGALLGMIAAKQRVGDLQGVQPTSIVTRLLDGTVATKYPKPPHGDLPDNEKHSITLAAVWTEIH